MGTLSNVTALLGGKLIKDRQEGITQLRSALATEHAADKLKPNDWIVLFAALFEAFAKEKQACIEKRIIHTVPTGAGAAQVRRLSEAASTVRFLVEKGTKAFTKALRRQILDHIVSNMKYQGRLIDAVALDYVKAMKCLFAWTPHLEHLEDNNWVKLVELSFNIILEDPFRKGLEEQVQPTEEQPTEQSDEEEGVSESVTSPRKRRLAGLSRATASPVPSSSRSLPVSLEKIEFASLLSMLLRSPNAPIISERHPLLPAALLNRLERFLVQYPADTSLHRDYLTALSATLSQIALNEQKLTVKFAKATWPALVGMWSTKNQRLKEDLVVILRMLFPYFTSALDEGEYDDGLSRLWKLLDGEAQSRWGVDSLSMDSLRFEIAKDETEPTSSAFAARTFRYGWHFESNQALAWVILELHADCGEKLYRLSESVHAIGGPSSKRRKINNPVEALLSSIRVSSSNNIRTFHFQALLFFIDRHWSILHAALQQQVIRTLIHCLSDDDPSTQSWSFVCLAAVAHVAGTSAPAIADSGGSRENHWDTVWTLAMRRANVPAVCRAACHAAQILLHHRKALLGSQRMVAEIETLAKDLDVQGPSAPYDSVCKFLVSCMHIASQDVSLYRLNLEDKVLAWLVDNWRPSSVSRRLPPYFVQDILDLLGDICSLALHDELSCDASLPDCIVVTGIKENAETAVLRDFSLYAKLPVFHKPIESRMEQTVPTIEAIDSSDVAPPGPRERKISSFFLKFLDIIAQDWDSQKDILILPTVEKVRSIMDFAITSLLFESSLRVNGTQSNRRVIQAACKVITHALPLLPDQRWTLGELRLLLESFDPLHLIGPRMDVQQPLEVLLPPGRLSGIRTEVLRTLIVDGPLPEARTKTFRRMLQRSLFRSSDVQDVSASIIKTMRSILRTVVDQVYPPPDRRREAENARDGFAGLRDSREGTPFIRSALGSSVVRNIMDTCFSVVSTFPALQSSSGEPTRDRELMQWFEDVVCSEDSHTAFFAVLPSLILQVADRTLHLSPSSLKSIFEWLGALIRTYNYRRDDGVKTLTASLLQSTMHIWLNPKGGHIEASDLAPHLMKWLIDNCLRHADQDPTTLSWYSRDSIILLLSEYIDQDPTQLAYMEIIEDEEQLPHTVLTRFGTDGDARVRARAAAVNARLLYHASALKLQPMNLYSLVRQSLSKLTSYFDLMLTRFLTLANLMIVSSAVRRGPYWHLLEISLVAPEYNHHLEVILQAVTDRMGMLSCSTLFEVYGPQIAYSVMKSGADFIRFPPRLLGFRDRRECADRTFLACAPIYLAYHESMEAFEQGRRQFLYHCRAAQRTADDGLLACLPEIIGNHMINWAYNHGLVESEDNPETDPLWQPVLKELYEAGTFHRNLREHADGVVATIVCALQDADFSSTGPIVKALDSRSQDAAQTFQELSSRRVRIQEYYEPSLPAFSPDIVLRTLDWFNHLVPHEGDPAITYHVLHRLLSALCEMPLLSEQVHLVNSLCLWISIHHDHFRDNKLVQVLLNGALNLIGQVDLVHDAQSILDWVFTHLFSRLNGTHLTEVLLRIACTAYDYSQSTAKDIASIGANVLDWAEDTAFALAKHRSLSSAVQMALLAWPRDPPQKLRALIKESSLGDLQTILSDERILSSKFRMVRQIYALAQAGQYEEDSFSKHDFWKLRQFIPSEEPLTGDEIQAFISLLVSQRGHIDGLDREKTSRQTASLRYLQQRRKDPQLEQNLLARKAIVSSLFSLLGDPSASRVHLAFKTLRALVAVTEGDLIGSNGWPTEHLTELQLLKAYSQPYSPRPTPDLIQLLEKEDAIRLSEVYPRWITFFTTLLSDILATHDAFYSPLALILQIDGHFAEQVLPILVHIYLYIDTSHMDDSSTRARNVISTYFSKLLAIETSSEACRKAIVDTVLHLREWPPPDFRDPLAYDKWLSVDFVELSQNAVLCGAYTTALLFLELAAEYANDGSITSQAKEEVLYQIYSRVDEPDGFYAISTQNVRGLLLKRLHHENQWDKAFQFHGAALETHKPDSDGANGVLRSLRAFGFDSLAMTTLQTMPGAETLVDRQMTYELGWRAGRWDLPQISNSDETSTSLYLALRAIHRERDTQVINNVVLEQLLQQMRHLKRLGHENLVEIRQVAQCLMCLNEIRRWCQADVQVLLRSDSEGLDERLLEAPRLVEFSDLEAILATRISLLRSAREREQRIQIGDMATPLTERLKAYETSYLLKLSRAAREAGNPQIAINSVVRAQKLNGKEHFQVACEFANVLWLTKEPKMATEFLKGLLSRPPQTSPKTEFTSHATLLALMGNWASQACLEKPADIKSHYFDAAVALMEGITSSNQSSVYHEYATFAERQYHVINKSPDVLRLKVYIDRKTAEIKHREDHLSQLKHQSGKPAGLGELQIYKNKAQKLLNNDQALYKESLKSRNTFLQGAIEMYSRCLASSDTFDDDAAIRLCSLWFANFDDIDEGLLSEVGAALGLIPSYKLVFLAHQLSARLSDAESTNERATNQSNLQRVILRMCREHPFHALFPVYCLQGGPIGTNKSTSSVNSQDSQMIRTKSATAILARLRSDTACAQRVVAVQNVCDASLQWAKHAIKKLTGKKSQPLEIPGELRISRLKNIQVPVITKHTPLDPTGRYDNCVWITRYDRAYETAGGINLPKICYCVGSDGKRYKQLFKGEGGDDLRQDAVMEQVFDLVNILLRNDRESTRRNLRIRGYKVVPLAAQAGVLEFVENTATLNEWLPKAHARYRPGDIRHGDFFAKMNNLQRSFGPPENIDAGRMTDQFVDLRKRFRPVMRHYFTETTKNPSEWFRMRLYYARSVATTSIVGHMIGLGDRHLSNILLDKRNGEVVHIDLGIAFEQGQLLPIAERVPFRLTADMVDGLGSTGTQGVFQRCAEHTLRVLRDRSDVILTVLEVFKYDPLHSWTASDMKLQGVQSTPARDRVEESTRDGADNALNRIIGFNVSTASGADEAADRALSAVARKLDKTLSIEFTVNELIAEATDVVNLANMFIGWSPHF
ncbi:hypothetical protein BDY19DRAFT_638931 [Irpex rosettiformis]|uniref:Uncharacterized protein n=1 Tax=Irpex rosettiformis TaxID=378272 RepID=A0ACB8UBV4_9APHY|nr:hypothetical protein BDY19DRAFT_638931 [Irpex rosettiformis]